MSYNTEAAGTWLKDKQLQDHLTTGICKHSSQAFLVFFIQPPIGASADIYKSVPVPLSRGIFLIFSFIYDIQHCFICRPTDSTVLGCWDRTQNVNLLRERLFVIS
jgi:hypothetical protein